MVPEKGEIVAPFDGKINVIFETGHAIGLTSSEGVELLIHIGIDTVNLKGKYFHPEKSSGDTIKKGEVILTFDKENIISEGYDITTPIVVSNTEKFSNILPTMSGEVMELDDILKIN